VTAETLRTQFDLIILSCKAYDLDDAMESFAPAVGPGSAILPLLNGMRHLERLAERFGPRAVLGGQCLISSTLDAEGRILHLSDNHSLSFGERDDAVTDRSRAIATALDGVKFETRLSDAILQEMWEKWVFIAAGAAITCLMRSAVGDIVAADAGDLAVAMLDECAAIAAQQGFPLREAVLQRSRAALTTAGSSFKASMLRDIERNARTEADHVIGDLLQRAGAPDPRSLLRIVAAQLAVYEAQRARMTATDKV
jgi:2-dehydropantoate 2-reductase